MGGQGVDRLKGRWPGGECLCPHHTQQKARSQASVLLLNLGAEVNDFLTHRETEEKTVLYLNGFSWVILLGTRIKTIKHE